MRVLGIETSSRVGSVALVEIDPGAVYLPSAQAPGTLPAEPAGRLVAQREHDQSGRHAEHLLPMIDALLAESGWTRGSLGRIAVGTGPGSFTGLRVGIALGQGIALGLGIPIVGIGSLRALAAVIPASVPGTRVALLDARRDEIFVAAFDQAGQQLLAPAAIARTLVPETLRALPQPLACAGDVAHQLELPAQWFTGHAAPQPHAVETARLAALLNESQLGLGTEAVYVRGAGATEQVLPASPLDQPPAAATVRASRD